MTSRLLAGTLVLGLLVGGCGGSDEASSEPDPPATSSSSSSSSSSSTATATPGPSTAPTAAEPGLPIDTLVGAATDALPVLFERAGPTYDADVAAALAVTTDDFAREFQTANDGVRRQFVRRGIVTTLDVSAAGVTRTTPTGGDVLVFFTQTTTTKAGQESPAQYSAEIELTDVAGTLLVDGIVTDLTTSPTAAVADPIPGYAEVLTAARDFGTGFTNLDYRTISEDQAAVRELSTGDFADQLGSVSDDLAGLVADNRSVLTSTVAAVGLVEGSATSATVVLATYGTVVNQATEGSDQSRNFRLRLGLVREDDDWLVDDLEFVD